MSISRVCLLVVTGFMTSLQITHDSGIGTSSNLSSFVKALFELTLLNTIMVLLGIIIMIMCRSFRSKLVLRC